MTLKSLKGEFVMSNNQKSLKLSHFLVRAFYFVVAVVFAICVYSIVIDFAVTYAVTLLIALPFGLGAVICLDRLLKNLKNKVVFDIKNVEIMGHLSIVCFSVSLVTLIEFTVLMLLFTEGFSDVLYSFVLYGIYPIMCIGEFFVGLIVRVVKNSFENAIALKEENDLTI